MKTLVLDPMPEKFWSLIKKRRLAKYFTTDQDNNNIEIIIIRTKTFLSQKYLEKYPELKLIIRAGSGFDNIDLVETKNRNIIVCTTPDSNAQAAFEHTISLILSLIKQHLTGKNQILKGRWKDEMKPCWEITDIKALIVGVGRIGTKVGKFLQTMGAEVKGVDPFLNSSEWQQRKIVDTDYVTGVRWCNLITYHCPFYNQTRDYFSKKILAEINNPVWLINTARGGILNEDAVKAGLRAGKILGLGMDVFAKEPVSQQDYFFEDNVLITPHIGAHTQNAKNRLISDTLEVWSEFVFHNNVINQIDYNFA
jgi:D-3-phosphoglycerate dehydrogenase / 2-oxoglutarate reductase